MELNSDRDSQVSNLLKELKTARAEIFNLRKEIQSLKHIQEKEVNRIKDKLSNWKCESCVTVQESQCEEEKDEKKDEKIFQFKPIGIISTPFSKKRGVPRQSGVCSSGRGTLTLFNTVFTNPEHALEGLGEFSHMWILFCFDRNSSTHVHAKVAPPRLNGNKTGVFATRSPHRPSPIGLSLVQIDSIEGSTVFFSGVDMLDGTPVLDIKPYIPQYDDPLQQGLKLLDESVEVRETPIAPGSPGVCPGHREAPDGEESDEDGVSNPTLVHTMTLAVRTPPWIKPRGQMTVELSKEAEEDLKGLNKLDLWPVIRSVLREDPRSVYIKQRYTNQFYTFLIADLHVSCKFNDPSYSVSVYRVAEAVEVSEGKEWPLPH